MTEIVLSTPPTVGVRPAMVVRDLWTGYDGKSVLEGVSFSVEQGGLVGIVGPNGAGKSTLFKAALGLLKLWHGEVEVMGQKMPGSKHLLGYTPQAELVDWQFPVSVLDVVMMGRYGKLGPLRRPTKVDREIALHALEQVKLADLAQRQIGELSGGQQRRMLVARTLAQEASVLLMDEPTAGLDATAQHELLAVLDTLRTRGKTILVATHDLSCVATYFDLALCLNRKVVAFGPPQEVFTEDILNATFQSHLLLVNVAGKLYASHK